MLNSELTDKKLVGKYKKVATYANKKSFDKKHLRKSIKVTNKNTYELTKTKKRQNEATKKMTNIKVKIKTLI